MGNSMISFSLFIVIIFTVISSVMFIDDCMISLSLRNPHNSINLIILIFFTV